MRSKIAALLAAVLTVAGLSFVTTVAVAPLASAHAHPATGTHKVGFKCDDGLYHSTLTLQYNLTYVSTMPNTNIKNYTFTLMTATYTGNTPNPARGPQIVVNSQLGPGYLQNFPLNATVGGFDSTSKYPFGPDTASKAVAPTKTNIAMTGSNGAPWAPFTITSNPAATKQVGRVYWYGRPNCAQDIPKFQWDLSNPDAPNTGTIQTSQLTCVSPALPNQDVPTDKLDVNYTVTPVSGDIYSFKLNNVILDRWNPFGDIYDGYTSAIGMHVEDSNGTIFDVAPSNTNHPMEMSVGAGPPYPNPLSIAEGQDLPGNENWGMQYPTIQFEYRQGDIIPKLIFLLERDGLVQGAEPPDCTISWDLSDAWNTAEDQYYNTDDIPFNTCGGGPQPAGHFVVTSYWNLNTNGVKVMSDHVVIQNNSPGPIKLHTGTGIQNPKFQSGVFGTTDLVFMNSNALTADRTWAAGQVKSLNISNPNIWTAIASGLPSTAPSIIKIDQPPNVAAFAMDWDVFDTSGFACAPGTSDLQDTVATSEL